MYKVAVLGERDSVLGFMALGFSVFEATDPGEAEETLRKVARSGEYAVIFVTERLAVLLSEEIGRYKDMPLPAIISIPGREGSTGYGMNSIRSAVERAVCAVIP